MESAVSFELCNSTEELSADVLTRHDDVAVRNIFLELARFVLIDTVIGVNLKAVHVEEGTDAGDGFAFDARCKRCNFQLIRRTEQIFQEIFVLQHVTDGLRSRDEDGRRIAAVGCYRFVHVFQAAVDIGGRVAPHIATRQRLLMREFAERDIVDDAGSAVGRRAGNREASVQHSLNSHPFDAADVHVHQFGDVACGQFLFTVCRSTGRNNGFTEAAFFDITNRGDAGRGQHRRSVLFRNKAVTSDISGAAITRYERSHLTRAFPVIHQDGFAGKCLFTTKERIAKKRSRAIHTVNSLEKLKGIGVVECHFL